MVALPLLYNANIREKLLKANKTSSPQTLFLYPQQGKNLSGQANLAGFWNTYDVLEKLIKQSIIILYSKKKIVLDKKLILLKEEVDYKKFKNNMHDWLRTAYYLGIILEKATVEDLLTILRS